MGEQTLPNFYAEDINNCMNRERRREALAKFLRIIKADVDRETKGKYLFVYYDSIYSNSAFCLHYFLFFYL